MVTSGDTVIIRGVPTKGPPPEKTISFAGVMAPRLARRPSPNDSRSTVQKDADGNERDSSKDQPGAWAAREFLRRKLIGQKVSFMVEYTAGAGGREFAPAQGPAPWCPARRRFWRSRRSCVRTMRPWSRKTAK